MTLDETLDAVAAELAKARRVLVITGAGLSADSGLPTYRGLGGLYNGETAEGVPIEAALSGQMLRQRPALCWKYMRQIGDACRGAGPNPGHHALARLQDRFEHLSVLTQNVDGFHSQAGSRDVIEIHGNLSRLVCTHCPWQGAAKGVRDPVPHCPSCGQVVRPTVVLFGEMLPDAAVLRLHQALDAGFDAVISVGTTSVFPYIAGPVHAAFAAGHLTVEVNPGETQVSPIVRWRLRCGAAQALTGLAERLGVGAEVHRSD